MFFFFKKKGTESSSKPPFSIRELLMLDYEQLPNPTFKKLETKVSTTGRLEMTFVKALPEKLCNLFSSMELNIWAGSKDIIITLRNTEPGTINVADIEKFVNACHQIYGEDTSYSRSGIFNKKDRADIEKRSWPGRLWITKNDEPDIMLSMDKEQLELTLLI